MFVLYFSPMLRSLRSPYFLVVTGAFLLLALSWGFCLPAFEAADEQSHYAFMVFIKDHWRLPRQLPLPAEVAGEGHQPPLYYLLGALWLRLAHPGASSVELPRRPGISFDRQPVFFDQDPGPYPGAWPASHTPVHELRALQVVLPLATLACLWLLLARLAPGTGAPRVAYAVMALNPAWCQLAGALNNDHTATTTFSVVLTLLVLAAANGRLESCGPPVLGVSLGLGMLAKLSILPLLPLTWMAVWIWSHRKTRDEAWVILVPTAIAGWWYVRNAMLYGDPFGWAMHRLTCSQNLHEKPVLEMGWWWFWLVRSFESFWSVFGWMTWRAPLAVTWTFAATVAAAAVGLVKRGWRTLSAGERRAGLLLALATAALVTGVARFNLEFDPPEGRYFYPALVAWGTALAWGLDPWLGALSPRTQHLVAWSVTGGLVALNLWLVTARLLPLYYGY